MFSRKFFAPALFLLKNAKKTKLLLKPKINLFSPKLYQTSFYNFSMEEGYLADYSDYTMAQGIMTQFVSHQSYNPQDILQVFTQLEKYKMGIVSSEPVYKSFLALVKKGFEKNFAPIELVYLAEKAGNIRIKDHQFWSYLLDSIKKCKGQLGVNSIVIVNHTLLRTKAFPKFVDYLSENTLEFQAIVKTGLKELKLQELIKAAYIFSFLNISFPELDQRFIEELNSNLTTLELFLSANDIATAALLVLNIPIETPDFDKERLLRDLSRQFISRDLLEYDLTLQHYEFDNPTPATTGIRDRLTWESIATMMRVYSQPDYLDQELLDRLKEAVYRKSESDLIDFETATVVLNVFSNTASAREDNDFYGRIVEMIVWQMTNEDPDAMIKQFDGKTIYHFLGALIKLYSHEFDPNLLNECFDYLAGIIKEGRLDSQLSSSDYKSLSRVFLEGRNIARFDIGVLDYLNNKISLSSGN